MRFRNYLTREELQLLEEASQKPFKPKTPAQKYKCAECSYSWLYKASRCPVCASARVGKT